MLVSARTPMMIACAMACAAPAAAQQPRTTTIATIPFRDCVLAQSNRPQTDCVGTGVAYMTLSNGSVMFMVGTADGRSLAFVAESDSQPGPESYTAYLVRLSTSFGGGSIQPEPVSGTCDVTMSRDGYIWSRLTCQTMDAQRRITRLVMNGNGQRATVRHPS